MEKRHSDEIWLTGYDGFMSIAQKGNLLITGIPKNLIYLWGWPFESRRGKEKGKFPVGQQVFGQPQRNFTTLEFQSPRMIDSIIINPEREEFVNDITISDNYFAVASGDYGAYLYNRATNKCEKSYGAMKPMSHVALSDQYFAYSSRDGSGIVKLPTFETIYEDQDFFGRFYLDKILIQGKFLIGKEFNRILVIDIPTEEMLLEFQTGRDRGFGRDCIATNENYVLGNVDSNICAWSLKTGEEVFNVSSVLQDVVSVAFNGKTVAAADRTGLISVWDFDTKEHRDTLQTRMQNCQKIFFSGKDLVVADGVIEIWKDLG